MYFILIIPNHTPRKHGHFCGGPAGLQTIPITAGILHVGIQSTRTNATPLEVYIFIVIDLKIMLQKKKSEGECFTCYISIVYSLDPIAYFQTVFRSLHLPVDSNCLGIHSSRLKAPLFPSERIHTF